MVASSNSGPRDRRPGAGRSRAGRGPHRCASGSSVTARRTAGATRSKRGHRAVAVGHVIEEAQRSVQVVRAGLGERRRCAPTSARWPGPATGARTPRACSVPAIWPVLISDAAVLRAATTARAASPRCWGRRTSRRPPRARWPRAGRRRRGRARRPRRRPGRRIRSACSVAAGWVPGARPSGSRAVAEAAVGVAVGGDGVADGPASPPRNRRSKRRRSRMRPPAARNWWAESREGIRRLNRAPAAAS